MLIRKINLFWLPIILVCLASISYANEYIIFSVAQDISMGEKVGNGRKNFYVNVGENQGAKEGTVLDVFRMISRLDTLNKNRRYNFRVKVGELEVVHSEKDASIANFKSFSKEAETPYAELDNFLIGDYVDIQVK